MLNRTEQPLFRPLTDIHIPEPSLVRLNDRMSLYVLHNSEQGVIRIDFMIRGGVWQRPCLSGREGVKGFDEERG